MFLLLTLTLVSVTTLANQVFYRVGSANVQTARGGEIFTDVGGANGINHHDIGMSLGAGLDLKLFNCPLVKNAELFGEIFVNYTKYSEEQVASVAHYLASGGTDTTKREVNVSELAVTIAPKYKMSFGKLKPWIIPIGLSFLVNSPPSNTTNYLDVGIHAGIGVEYEIIKQVSLGVDFRYNKGSGDPSFTFESTDLGAYLAINF